MKSCVMQLLKSQMHTVNCYEHHECGLVVITLELCVEDVFHTGTVGYKRSLP